MKNEEMKDERLDYAWRTTFIGGLIIDSTAIVVAPDVPEAFSKTREHIRRRYQNPEQWRVVKVECLGTVS